MNLHECIEFATAHPFCYLATIDGDQARVRTVLLVFADETGFYFETVKGKDMSNQLHANPNVEFCFTNGSTDLMSAKHMRLTGMAEFMDDPEIIDKVYEIIKGLEEIAGGPFKEYLEVYRIGKGTVHFWTIKDMGKEAEIERLQF
jgi:uncharacterized pyridoxamine 5'-phosphate oxidase family protein